MLKFGIIVGSTRPGRKAGVVAKWVHDILKSRKDAEFEVVDIEDYKLPLLDEPVPPIMHQYGQPHTKRWSEKIASLDAYIFVTPEYNHATSAALKNAIDFLFHEWNNKAAGFVGYGGAGGVRAVENLRLVMGEIKVADVRAQVALVKLADPVRVFQNFATLDLLSQGRTELVVGRGSFIDSFPLFGFKLGDYDSLFAEKLDLLLKIRENEHVYWSGKHRAALTGQGVYPRPVQFGVDCFLPMSDVRVRPGVFC